MGKAWDKLPKPATGRQARFSDGRKRSRQWGKASAQSWRIQKSAGKDGEGDSRSAGRRAASAAVKRLRKK